MPSCIARPDLHTTRMMFLRNVITWPPLLCDLTGASNISFPMQTLLPYVYDGRHACRLCERTERQQQRQQEHQQQHQKNILEAQKQQYIDFMTEMRKQCTGPDPTSPGQTLAHSANGQSPLPLPQTDGDAHELGQVPEQLLRPPPEQVQQQTPQGRKAQFSRSLTVSEELPPAVQTPSAFNDQVYNR